MTDVRVRCETAMLGLIVGEEVELTRTPLIEAAIAQGRFTVIDADGDEAPLRGAVLDAALEAAGLSTSGSVAEKRARLAEHQSSGGAGKVPGPDLPPPGTAPDPGAVG